MFGSMYQFLFMFFKAVFTNYFEDREQMFDFFFLYFPFLIVIVKDLMIQMF